MATITLEYDGRNKGALSMLKALLDIGLFKVKSVDKVKPEVCKPNAVERSLQEVRDGKVNSYASVSDFFKKKKIQV